jgi:ABC-2 type transport system permease protein
MTFALIPVVVAAGSAKFVIIPIVVVGIVLRIVLYRARRRRAGGGPAPGRAASLAASLRARLARRVADVGGEVGLVARREIRERVRGRTFRIATLIMLLFVAAAVTIPVLTKNSKTTAQHIGVVGTLSGALRATVIATGDALHSPVNLVAEPSLGAAEEALGAGKVVAVLDGTTRIVVDKPIQSGDTSSTALLVRSLSASIGLQAGLERAGIAPVQAARLAHPPPLPVTSLHGAPRNQAARTTSIYGLILTYVLLTQYGTWLLMGVIEEKSSRVIEVLLSTLRPRQLLSGKVIGIGAVAMMQAALIVGLALGLGAAEGSTLLHGTVPLQVVSSLLWVVLGYAFYSWVYAAAGSLADRQDQVQSLALPVQLPILFGYIASLSSLSAAGASTLEKVLAYLPPTAPFAMPVLVGVGAATWWEFLISVCLTLLAISLVARVASTIYFRAILRTGGRVHLRQLFAAGTA